MMLLIHTVQKDQRNPTVNFFFKYHVSTHTKITTIEVNTGKPVYVVTSIKQSPVLKGHIFLPYHRQFHMN